MVENPGVVVMTLVVEDCELGGRVVVEDCIVVEGEDRDVSIVVSVVMLETVVALAGEVVLVAAIEVDVVGRIAKKRQ